MSTVTVITAIYGGYDSLKEPEPQTVDVEWICVTDDPGLKSDAWKVVVEPRPELHPRMAAKAPKFCPHLYAPATPTIWIDAAFRVAAPDFAARMLDLLNRSSWAMFAHPWRDCIYDEANASVELLKYRGQPIGEQVAAYRELGHPAHGGLWATGVIGRRFSEPATRLGRAWWEECERWTIQDQLSFPFLTRLFAIRPVAIPGDIYQTAWLRYEGHIGGDR